MMKSNSVRAAWCWDSILYVVMIIYVFGALGSFFMLHDTKAAIEKFSLMENGFKEEEKRALQIPFLVMDKSGFK